MKIFFVLVCVIALTFARPDEEGDEKPKITLELEQLEDGEAAEPKGDEKPKDEEENLWWPPYSDDDDVVTHDNKEKESSGEAGYRVTFEEEGLKAADMTTPPLVASVVTLKIPDDEEPPKNAVTNNYGEAMKTEDVIEYNLGSHSVQIFTEKWVTQFMRPATKPNCLCQTRGPLPQFKLIGNIHFRHVKKPPKHRFLTSTDASVTECPPCNCADCFTTQTVTRRRDKVC